MNTLGSLDAEEVALIERHRQEKVRAAAKAANTSKVLMLAARYERWLQHNGRGSSFSTFVNEFCYEQADCKEMFRIVEAIRALARDSF